MTESRPKISMRGVHKRCDTKVVLDGRAEAPIKIAVRT
jgi:hypothetical protein